MVNNSTTLDPQTPQPPAMALERSTSSTQNVKNQRTLLGFFQKTPHPSSTPPLLTESIPTLVRKDGGPKRKTRLSTEKSQLTPAPSSDAFELDEVTPESDVSRVISQSDHELPSPVSLAHGKPVRKNLKGDQESAAFGTLSRQVSSIRL